MKNRILNYKKQIDNDILNYESDSDYAKKVISYAIDKHLVQISFFQHERFIHLIVTFLFTLIAFACVLFTVIHFEISILILTILSFVLLIPYVKHYYLLENNVQYMYKQYDKMINIKNNIF